jgi:tetratricopeptide (TPR) repeat protein
MAKRDKYTAPRNPQRYASNEEVVPTAEDRLKGIESWYESNKKILNGILIGGLAIVAVFFAYNRFYKGPQNEKANDAVFMAQDYFANDSMNLALNGDGNNFGALKIGDKYGSTDAGNLSHFYAGRALLGQGKYQEAIKELKDFDGKGTMPGTVALGCIGDAYMELNKPSEAITYYKKATADEDDVFLTPLYLERLGLVYESTGKTKEAIEAFTRIKLGFPSSAAARNADKYLARLGEYNL